MVARSSVIQVIVKTMRARVVPGTLHMRHACRFAT